MEARRLLAQLGGASAAQLLCDGRLYVAACAGCELAVSTVDIATGRLRAAQLRVPATPNRRNGPSDQVACVQLLVVPAEIEREPVLAVGLENGSFYLLGLDGALLFAYTGLEPAAQFPQLGRIRRILTPQATKFVTGYALCLKFDGGVAVASQQALIRALLANADQHRLLLGQVRADELRDGPHTLLVRDRSYCTDIGLVITTFDRIRAPNFPRNTPHVLLEDTNILLLACDPFMVKIVPLSGDRFTELSAPIGIQTRIASVNLHELEPGKSYVLHGEEYDFAITSSIGQVCYQTYYKAAFFLDTLDVAVGDPSYAL